MKSNKLNISTSRQIQPDTIGDQIYQKQALWKLKVEEKNLLKKYKQEAESAYEDQMVCTFKPMTNIKESQKPKTAK